MPPSPSAYADRGFRAALALQLVEVEEGVVAEVRRLQEVAAALAEENGRLQRELALAAAALEDAAAAAALVDTRAAAADLVEEEGSALVPANAVDTWGRPHFPHLEQCAAHGRHGGDAGDHEENLLSMREAAGYLFPVSEPVMSKVVVDDPKQTSPSESSWESGEGSHEGRTTTTSSARQLGSAASPATKLLEGAGTLSEGSSTSPRPASLRLSAGSQLLMPFRMPHMLPARRQSVVQDVAAKIVVSTKLGALIAAQQHLQRHDDPEGQPPKQGLCARLLRDTRFQATTLDTGIAVIILLNSAVIGINSDFAQGWAGWIVVDLVFALIFLVECLLKIFILRPRDFFCGPEWRWNLFEVGLVALAIFEIPLAVLELGHEDGGSDMSLFRIIRLARIIRLVRVCRLEIFGDLMFMIRGMMGGAHVLGWAVVLISLPLYAVALVFRETVGKSTVPETGAECFNSVAQSFFTLFRCIVGGDCGEQHGWPVFLVVTTNYGWFYGVIYCATMVFMTFGLFNVIVAIFVENAVNTAKFNDQMVQRQRLRDDTFFLKKMMELIELIWHETQNDGEGTARRRWQSATQMLSEAADLEITPELFQTLLENPKFHGILVELDIADEDQFFLFQTLDASGDGKVTIDELMEGIAKLRGDARRSDIVAVHVMLNNLATEVHELMAQVRTGQPAALADDGHLDFHNEE